MFTNVTISNFRTFETATLDDLGKTTALIGRNASGKSNLLHALDAFGRLASAAEGGRTVGAMFASINWWEKLPSFTADIALEGKHYQYSLSAMRVFAPYSPTKRATLQFTLSEQLDRTDAKLSSDPKRVFTRDDDTISFPDGSPSIRTGRDMPALAALSALLPADSPVWRLTEPLRQFFARVRYYPLDEPARDNAMSQSFPGSAYNEWVDEYRRTGVLGGPVQVQILYLALTAEDRFIELKDRLGQKGLRLVTGITLHDSTGDATALPHLDPGTGLLDPNAFYAVVFRLSAGGEESDSERSFSQLSQGTRRLVRLLTAMAYGDDSVMLIEHPEDGIHRGLLKKVVGLFTTGFCPSQIFLSTHSDTVLNGLEPKAIRFVSLDDGKSTVRKMTPAEQKAAREYIDSDAEGTLAEFAHSIED